MKFVRPISMALFCAFVGACSVHAQDAPSPKKVALLVGVNRYDKPIFSPLNYSERDVEEMGVELKALGFDVTVLKGSGDDEQRATHANIRAVLERLVQPLGSDDVMLVMFSGHGQQLNVQRRDGTEHDDAFYCPVDAVSNKPETMVSLSYVIDDVLAPNVGRKLLLVDACRDAPKDPARGSKGIQGRVIALPEDTAVLFSCRAGQQSWENDELQHGLFTYCVLEALRQQGDDEVTWSKVVTHVDERMASDDMRARMGRPQDPIPAGGVSRTVLGRIGVRPAGTPKPGDVITNTIEAKLVLIPAGEFPMGSQATEAERRDDEGPQHRVRITRPFLMGQFEVTQSEWQAVMGTNPSWFSSSGRGKDKVTGLDTSRFPVESMSWYDAVEFCNKLSEREKLSPYYTLSSVERAEGSIKSATVSIGGGKGYRLPTEAEWEYACRAGTTTPFHFGATSNGRESNIDGDDPYGTTTKGPRLGRTTAVGSYAPNAFGLYDMHGNVHEWCTDWYDASAYQNRSGTTRDPLVQSGERKSRVLRGGTWNYGVTRSAYRGRSSPNLRNYINGFRLARTP